MATVHLLRPRLHSIVKLRDEVETSCRTCGAGVRLRRGALRPHNRGMRLCPGSWQLPAKQGPVPGRAAGNL